MADELATITGTIYLNGADDPDRVPWPDALVRATPVLLDETAALADSRTTRAAVTDSAGLVTLHLWPGAWAIHLPDGEVIDGDGGGVVIEAGTTYTLLGLRGYVAPPGTTVTTVELPTGGATGQLLAKASEDDYDVEWKSAAGTGDMLTTTYDPTGVAADAFSMGSMVESGDAKIMTAAERALLAQQSGTNTGDQDLSGLVPNTRTVNGKPLSANVTLTASDVGAATPQQVTDGDTATLSAAQSHAQALVDALTAASPATLDTLAEIADALGADPNFAATMTTALGNRVRFDAAQTLTVPQQERARTNIGAAPALGADDNYVTDAEKVVIGNTSGTNTGDQTLPTWSTIADKPAVVAAGATQADARSAIGAGTSNLTIGTTAGTAKEGDYAPDLSAYLTSAAAASAYAPLSGQFATHTLTAAATVTLSADCPAQSLTMTQDTTLAAPTISDGHAILLWLSGAFVPTWWAGIKWAGGEPPTYDSGGTLYHLAKHGAVGWLGSGQAYS